MKDTTTNIRGTVRVHCAIDDHDPLAAVCHCEWCQGSSKVERADAVLAEAVTCQEVLP
jgi:hypothetical protein